MSSFTSAGLSRRACHAAATEWNCRSEQSNLAEGHSQGQMIDGEGCGKLRQHKPPFLPDLSSPLSAPATLELDVQGGEGLHADEVVHHTCCIGIVGTVVELVNCTCWVLKALISEATDNRSQQKLFTHPSSAH